MVAGGTGITPMYQVSSCGAHACLCCTRALRALLSCTLQLHMAEGLFDKHANDCRQVIQAILKDKGDETEVALLYANQSPDDILLHAELQQMATHPRVKVWYTGQASQLDH